MKRVSFVTSVLAALLGASLTAAASTPMHVFSKGFGSAFDDRAGGISADGSGNVFCTGYFHATVNLGGTDLVSAGQSDIYLAKYAAGGQHLWSRRLGSLAAEVGSDVAADASGNVFVVGNCRGNVDFGGGVLAGGTDADAFLAKYDPDGNHLWSLRLGSTSDDAANGVVTDGAGNVIVSGFFQDTISVGVDTLQSEGGWDAYVAKFDANGSPLWGRSAGGLGNDTGLEVAVDAAGGVVLIGYFVGSMNWGGSALNSAGLSDIYLVKFDASGAHQWSQRFGAAGYDQGYRIAIDADGNVYFAAAFEQTVSFGGAPLSSAGASDAVLAKLDGSGTHQWSRHFGSTESDTAVGVGVDAWGRVSLAGHFHGSVDFGGEFLDSQGGTDVFLLSLESNGDLRWGKSFGGSGSELANRLATDATGSLLFTGSHNGVGDVGGGPLTHFGNTDILILKYRAETEDPIIRSIRDVAADNGRKVEIQFERSGHDHADDVTPVTSYEVYRRDDPLPSATPGKRMEGWTLVAYVPTSGDPQLVTQATTLADSTISEGPYETTFLVRAATAAPAIYFDSDVGSGHSLDNLAPVAPFSLSYSAAVLDWSDVVSPDFDYFAIYGAATNEFAAAVLIDYTIASSMDVSSSPYGHYFVTATDFSGNESLPSSVDSPTSTENAPQRFVLAIRNYPNPFNPRTTISYSLPETAKVRIAIFDARGKRVTTLVDGVKQAAGSHQLSWNGLTDGGTVAPSGIYHARIEANAEIRSRKMLLVK